MNNDGQRLQDSDLFIAGGHWTLDPNPDPLSKAESGALLRLDLPPLNFCSAKSGEQPGYADLVVQ